METMEGYGGGLGSYWRRKKYSRLFGGRENRLRVERGRRRVVLGNPPEEKKTKPRRLWRIRISRRLKVLREVISPRRLLTRLRDAYVRMMMSLAGSGSFSSGGPIDFYGGGRAAASLKEYDERMIVQIYKSLVAEKHLVPAPGCATLSPH